MAVSSNFGKPDDVRAADPDERYAGEQPMTQGNVRSIEDASGNVAGERKIVPKAQAISSN